jgi:hypothetical protein
MGAAVLRDPAHPLWSRPAPGACRVRIESTKGSFVMEPDRAPAPPGADRFYHLVETGFYDAATEFVEEVQRFEPAKRPRIVR